MACTKFNQSVLEACRNSQPGLVGAIYLANYSEVLGFGTDAGATSITGITMSGTTKFYKLAINKQVATMVDTGTISIANGTAVSKPKLTFKIQGWNSTNTAIYNQLLQATVVAVVKAVDGTLWGVGFHNGLDATELTYGTESDPAGFKGITISLEGLEAVTFYQIATALNFETAFVN